MDYYEKFAPFYETVGLRRGHFASQIDFLTLYIMSSKKVLDAACGTGNVIDFFQRKHPDKVFVGSDKSCNFTRIAKKKQNINPQNIHTVSWDKLNISFNSQEFDLIFILGNSITHVETESELEIVFKNVYDILEKDGLFLFDFRDWTKNIKEGSFNLPLKSEIIDIEIKNELFYYHTEYDKIKNRHFLIHNLYQGKRLVKKIELSFLDISTQRILEIGKKCGFEMRLIDNREYPFISIECIKCK